MNISVHLTTSFVLSAILYPFYGPISLIAVIGGYLIDVDHWMWYVYKTHDLSIKRSYWWYVDKKYKPPVLNIFHTVEVWLIAFVISLYWIPGFIITLGMYMHLILDYLHAWWSGSKQERPFFLIPWIFGVR